MSQDFEDIAKTNFSRWNNALKGGEYKSVSALYFDDATFLPTLSGEFVLEKNGTEEYFKHFLLKKPRGAIVEEKIQSMGRNCYLHSGLYNFETNPDGQKNTVKARFSFVWMKDSRGEWKIAHHHSSLKPEGKKRTANY